MTEYERGEVRRLRSCGGEYSGCSPDPVSRASEKGIRMRMFSAEMTMVSVLGSRGAVGTAGKGLDWEVRYPSCWMASGTFRHFFH